MAKVSCIIASRNEPYLKKTIDDILQKAKGDIEVIAILDGSWDRNGDYSEDPRVSYLYFPESRGLREAVNTGVAVSRGDFILKCDAHVLFDEGFDEKLKADCEKDWVVVPYRYALDADNWKIEERKDDKYPIAYEYFVYGDKERGLYSTNWHERNRSRENILIDDTPSSQGSCWFLHKDYFYELELFEEKYGLFFLEFQEVALKSWLYGGGVKVNKKTYFAHLHKTGGRGYSLPSGEREKSIKAMNDWLTNTAWKKQKRPFKWLLEKFPDMPGWEKWKS